MAVQSSSSSTKVASSAPIRVFRRRSSFREHELRDGTRIPLTPRRDHHGEEALIESYLKKNKVSRESAPNVCGEEIDIVGDDIEVLTSADLVGFGIEAYACGRGRISFED